MPLPGLPILQLQADDRHEMPKIVRHEGEIMRPRGRGDQEIHRRDALTSAHEVGADEAVVLSAEFVKEGTGTVCKTP